jgi:hypothetical protein
MIENLGKNNSFARPRTRSFARRSENNETPKK